MKWFLQKLLKNSVLANILMLLIIIGGVLSTKIMVREMFPNFSLDVINISVAYPGAMPKEIEESICLKLEDAVDGVSGVKEVRTIAKEGSGSAIIKVETGFDLTKVKDEIETNVNSIRTFPDKAEKPIITELTVRKQVLNLALYGQDERKLKNYAEVLKDSIQNVDGISQVTIAGTRDDEISIEVPEANLRKYGLSFSDINKAIADNGISLTAGTIKNSSEEITLEVASRKYSAKEYAAVPIKTLPTGEKLNLGQIATIKDSFDADDKKTVLFNGKPAVLVSIFKTEQEDSINISKKIDTFIAETKLPNGMKLEKFSDYSRFVSERLGMLEKNGIIGLILVILILWIFLDLRLSLWVSIGIPISIAGGLILMAVCGYSLNMITMFGMIMVLGIIVDDAIVIGESIYHRRSLGDSPMDAAVNGTAEVAIPVVAAVLTTVIAFLPLLFISGVMGKFIGQIPVPVIAALFVSLVEGLFILPVHLRHLPEIKQADKSSLRGRFRTKIANSLKYVIERIYSPILKLSLKFRYIVFALSIFVFLVVMGLYSSGFVKFIFFPEADEDFLTATVELAPGTPIKQTEELAEHIINSWNKVEKQYKLDGDLSVAKVAFLGTVSGWEKVSKANVMEIQIELMPAEQRNIYYKKLLNKWEKEIGPIPNSVSAKFAGVERGPGGSPIEVTLLGNSKADLLQSSDALMQKLNSIDGVYNIQTDYRSGKKVFELQPKPSAYHFGISSNDIAQHLYTGFYGSEVLNVQRDRDNVKVKLRYPDSLSNSVEYFNSVKIPTRLGQDIPLLMLADVNIKEGDSVINRFYRKRAITVSADVNNDVGNAEVIINDLKRNFLPNMKSTYHTQYLLEGQRKEKQDTMQDLMIGFPIALFAIYFIIASLFRSYIQPIVIMLTIPFGLIGAIIGHMLLGYPITIMSIFGMVALAGIVLNDAIVLIEGVNSRLELGHSFNDSLIEGGKRRFRAILLTTLTTFCGLMPIILERSMQAQVLIPMAISIAFGVLFATVITLIIIPCVLGILNDVKRILYFSWNFSMPSAEEVEPRYNISKLK